MFQLIHTMLLSFVAMFFGISRESLEAIEGSSSVSSFYYITFMLIFGPIIIAVALASTLHTLLGMQWIMAIATAIIVGVVVAMTDRYFVLQRIKNQSSNTLRFKFFLLRSLTWLVMIFLGISTTANLLSSSVDAHTAQKVEKELTTLLSNDSQLKSLNTLLLKENETQKRHSELLKNIQEHQQKASEYRSGMTAEEQGITIDGKSIAEGRGQRYYASQNGYQFETAQANSLKSELTALNFNPETSNNLINQITEREKSLKDDVSLRHGGTLNKIKNLYEIIIDDPIKLVYVIFTTIIALIVEITYTMALTSLPKNDTLRSLFDIQQRNELARLHLIRSRARAEIQDQLPTEVVQLPNRPRTLWADTNEDLVTGENSCPENSQNYSNEGRELNNHSA